jgi:methylphosphotriester-DNA--protein-cysteine methyltransferase
MRILPDGSADLMFDLAAGGTSAVGAMRTALVLQPQSRLDLLGVRFHPGAAWRLLRTPLDELTDRVVSAREISRGLDLAPRLAEADPSLRIAALESALLERAASPPDRAVAAAISFLERTGGRARIARVAVESGLGERSMERRFRALAGVPPKALARVFRFSRAVQRIHQGATAFAGIALDCGYADQAHFVREFARLAGITPARYARERRVGFVQDGALDGA